VSASNQNAGGIGFLTVMSDQGQGWIGGYLIVTAAARPLEFHCTSPVKPNRAQEILYGPTLGCYLMGEQIAAALVKKSAATPLCVITDIEAVLAVRNQIEIPVVLLMPDRQGETPLSAPLIEFELAGRRVAVSDDLAADRQQMLSSFPAIPRSFDLAEPLQRIREAIVETQLRGRAA
jgi:hypothetical protein